MFTLNAVKFKWVDSAGKKKLGEAIKRKEKAVINEPTAIHLARFPLEPKYAINITVGIYPKSPK